MLRLLVGMDKLFHVFLACGDNIFRLSLQGIKEPFTYSLITGVIGRSSMAISYGMHVEKVPSILRT